MKKNRQVINDRCDIDNYTVWNERLLEKSWGRVCMLDILTGDNHTTGYCERFKNCQACISEWLNRKDGINV